MCALRIAFGINDQDMFGTAFPAPPSVVHPMIVTYGGDPAGAKRYKGPVRAVWFGNRPVPAGKGGIVKDDLPLMTAGRPALPKP